MSPRRIRFRANLHRLYLPVYDFLAENLESYWEPVRGFVPFDMQEATWEQGRKTPGRILTQQQPGESPYNYGCASAWVIFDRAGKPCQHIAPSDWAYFADLVEKAGGLWGGRFMGQRDKSHAELSIRKSWEDVNRARQSGGLNAAHKYIEGNLCP